MNTNKILSYVFLALLAITLVMVFFFNAYHHLFTAAIYLMLYLAYRSEGEAEEEKKDKIGRANL